MWRLALVAAIDLVTFHTVDGRYVTVNAAAVQQLVRPREPRHLMMVEGVQCVIMLSGSYVSVTESCEEVQRVLEGVK